MSRPDHFGEEIGETLWALLPKWVCQNVDNPEAGFVLRVRFRGQVCVCEGFSDLVDDHREGVKCWERNQGTLTKPGWRLDSTAGQASPHFARHIGRSL